MLFCTFVLDLALGWRQQGSRKVRHYAIKRQRPCSDERFTRKCRPTGDLVHDVMYFVHMRKAWPSTFLLYHKLNREGFPTEPWSANIHTLCSTPVYLAAEKCQPFLPEVQATCDKFVLVFALLDRRHQVCNNAGYLSDETAEELRVYCTYTFSCSCTRIIRSCAMHLGISPK